ncbi:insulinase family protein [Butyrivibrio sp. WCE2006]|uniref:insulinase family protein n=1 Tax=Butyrivibrio sp. WCE2006 TaxID=1410611 RepID=UPI0005D2C97C|nr:insulinase family protein [Butyrivibrio sp. WCE2006]
MRVEELNTYEVLEHRRIEDLNSDSYIVRHKKTGAKLALLSNDDDNKVFYIGFRTPPKDSTGVAHIIEHTVLCGSKEFPIKDPFVELVKGSLNTFLNAMTYPDKTVYPIASCNDADFQNLMHVYLDAVFYPNIYQTEKIFKQEGWHYEMENADDELKINGVVYNEMKGAFSNADEIVARQIRKSLYPDTTYGIESGGDPDEIYNLTYEDYLDFHRKYYHPSNSYIYLYGNMDMVEKLQYIDENYLSKYDYLEVDSSIGLQKSFDGRKSYTGKYPILNEESERDNTYLTLNYSVGSSLDPKFYVAFDILDYALCSAPGAPIKKALIDKGIGSEVFSDYDNGIIQPVFSIVAKNANPEQKDEFIATVEEVLRSQVENGIDKKALLAGLNADEFKYREADFGRFPKGLLYGLQVLDSWLYDEKKPWINIEANNTFAELKKEVETGYFESLIEKYLLNNNHSTVLVMEPEKGLTEKKDRELADKLKAYRDSLSSEEVDKIVRETKELKAYQEEPDRPEDLAKIPLLTRGDIKKEADKFINEEKTVGKQKILFHNVFTNGIGYINFVFDIKNVPDRLLPYTPLLKLLLGLMDTENYSYTDLYNEINLQTGGISGSISTYTDAQNVSEFTTTFEVAVKALYPQLDKAFELVSEIIFRTKFDDDKRMLEILDETCSRLRSDLASAGHHSAALRALSYVSKPAKISDMVSGIGGYRMLEEVKEKLSKDKGYALEIADNMQELCRIIFRPENLLVDYTASEKEYVGFEDKVTAFADKLYTDEIQVKGFEIKCSKQNEGFQTAGQVQYVCLAGNFANKGLKYDGSLRVLKVMLGYDYLWKNIRVLGGAYGCMSGFSKNGDSYFATYRDPHLSRSIDVFKEASDYLKNFEADERTVTQFVIGAVSDLDTPKTPATKGAYGLTAYLCHTNMKDIQADRDALLATDIEKIRGLSAYIDAFMEDDCLCVVGDGNKILQNKDLFGKVEQLIYAGKSE